jgi:hypothetical protein
VDVGTDDADEVVGCEIVCTVVGADVGEDEVKLANPYDAPLKAPVRGRIRRGETTGSRKAHTQYEGCCES